MEMRASVSSQNVSAVLMASTLFHKSSSADFFHLKFDGAVVSWPYVEITLGMMRAFGVDAHATEDRRGILIPATGMFQGRAYLIEPDASNASYFLAAAALIDQSYCCISHLGPDSLQGDAKFYRVLRKMGARAWSRNKPHTGIRALGGQLRGIDIGLNDMPDMAQTLAVIALFAQGPTIIRNVGNLRVKETDRIEALRIELTKLGAEVRIMADDIHIMPPKGNTLINAANGRPMSERNPVHIDTYDDHRMAMAFSIAGLKQAGLWINNPECVNKTFPDFFKYLKYLHVNAKG
jgi:3-phosphoshikimate 1-carboxyvinyltransferase